MDSSRVTRLLIITFLQDVILAGNITEVDRLYYSIMDNYNNKMFPVINHTTPTAVGVTLFISSLNNFDQVSGELSVSFIFDLTWTEERISWIPRNHAGITQLLLPPDDIWRPQIIVLETADRLDDIGNTPIKVKVTFNGTVTWHPGSVIKSICAVDVTYFPFDTQTCSMRLLPWGTVPAEMYLFGTSDYLRQDYLIPNSEWEILTSTVFTPALGHGRYLQLDLQLKRRRIFYVVYIIIPLVFLSVLNSLVFLLPASSGERSSVAMTTFLSFVMYMSIVKDNVPSSSEPISYLYFYLLFLMSYSSAIMILCTLSLRIYDKDGAVPTVVKSVVRFLKFQWLRRKGKTTNHRLQQQGKITSNGTEMVKRDGVDTNGQSTNAVMVNGIGVDKGVSVNTDAEEKTGLQDDTIMWKDVGKTFDACTFLTLLCVYTSVTSVCYYRLYSNSGYVF